VRVCATCRHPWQRTRAFRTMLESRCPAAFGGFSPLGSSTMRLIVGIEASRQLSTTTCPNSSVPPPSCRAAHVEKERDNRGLTGKAARLRMLIPGQSLQAPQRCHELTQERRCPMAQRSTGSRSENTADGASRTPSTALQPRPKQGIDSAWRNSGQSINISPPHKFSAPPPFQRGNEPQAPAIDN
jgi:hypothetical protein